MIGVLIMAYGGPNNIQEVEPYLLDVRSHRPTSTEIIQEVRERYHQIGGRSPILEQTRAQAQALEAALNADGQDFKVCVGMRHWHPYIQNTLAAMNTDKIRTVIGLVMAPHYSYMSIGAYYKKVDEAGLPIQLVRIEDWHLLPGYLDALADHIRAALEKFPAEARAQVPIVFTAHSLPQRILQAGDPYPVRLRETMAALMERLSPQHPHEFAFQSAAISNEPWLGPDAADVIARLASEGKKHVLLAPIGFVCEHVEILYDVDIIFKQQADKLGMQLERIEMLGTAPKMIAGLAGLIREKAKEAAWL
jgi:ferrochelatase